MRSGHQESKNFRNSHPSARRREPQADAGQATGEPSFVLGGQYPITAYYVKSESAAAQEGRVHKAGAFDVQLRHEGTNITGKEVDADLKELARMRREQVLLRSDSGG